MKAPDKETPQLLESNALFSDLVPNFDSSEQLDSLRVNIVEIKRCLSAKQVL